MADYEYRFLGDMPKVFTPRVVGGAQFVNPGETVRSDEPLHHGELEPTSDLAMAFAEENGLALVRDGGEAWKRPDSTKAAKKASAVDTTPPASAPPAKEGE